MDNSLSKEATDWREGRRLRAFELKKEGWSHQRIAEALGVSKGAVSEWMKRVREGGGVQADRGQAARHLGRLSDSSRAGVLKDFLASGASSRVQLEQLPGYAPDLNPDEGVWK